MNSIASMTKSPNVTLSTSTRSAVDAYMALSEAEKKSYRRILNERSKAIQSESVYTNRLKASGIPKAYELADVADIPEYAQAFEKLKSGEIVGLILRGNVGRGKTYTACAMLREHLKTKLGRFATMNDILARIRGAYSSGENPEEIFSRYRGTPLLVLDDLGKENISADSITKLFELLDARIANERPTIVTTQFTNAELMRRYSRVNEPEIQAAILSRLGMFSTIEFHGKDRRNQ